MGKCPAFFGFNSRVIALDTSESADGAQLWRWKAPSGGGNGEVAVLYFQDQLFASVMGYTYRLDPDTGKELWHNNLPGTGTGIPHLLRACDLLFVGFNAQIVALNPDTGKTESTIQKWTAPAGKGEVAMIETASERLVVSVDGYAYGLDCQLHQLWHNDNPNTGSGVPTLATSCLPAS